MTRSIKRAARAAAGLLAAACAASAHATWSIIIVDTRTREVAVASATCLTEFDLRNGTPVVITGVGAATAQSSVDSTGNNRVYIRDRMIEGLAPNAILDALLSFDTSPQTRQYGIVSVTPAGVGRAGTFSGTQASQWRGGRTGQAGSLVYAVQGNILTGAAVVDAAVAAIQNTPGDVPARLMAAMEAARAFGGDGRCSCPGPSPTACGAPPPNFRVSANIGYMIIARAGDRDASNGLYALGSMAAGIAVGDADGNGRPDLFSVHPSAAVVNALRNTTPAGSVFGLFAQRRQSPAGVAQPRLIGALDLNGDGRSELVVASGAAPARLRILRLGGDGSVVGGTDLALPAIARGLTVDDLNGDGRADVVLTLDGAVIAACLNDGAGALAAPTVFATGAAGSAYTSPVVLDVNGDGTRDVAVLDGLGNIATHLSGSTQAVLTPVGAGTLSLARIDLDGDGPDDVAVNRNSPFELVFGRGWSASGFELTRVAPGFVPAGLTVADLNRDGRDDVAVAGAARVAVYLGSPAGPALDRVVNYNDGLFFSYAPSLLLPADVDGDGYPDLAGLNNNQMMTMENLGADGPGRLTDGLGTAAGDYFMNFNIANASASDPDPVVLLRERFDAWRAGLAGRPDAVASSAALGRGCVPIGGSAELTVELRDWAGAPADAASLRVTHARGSAGRSIIGQPQRVGPGLFTVRLEAPASALPGEDRLAVTADDGVRAVTLMPETRVRVSDSADFDGDGTVDFNDLLSFLNDYNAGLPRADLNRDGTVDFNDLLAFLDALAAGC